MSELAEISSNRPTRPSTRDDLILLLVEDDPVDARRIEEHLAAGITDGFLLDRAETLEQALDYLRRFEYDAAFVDLTLPDSAGVAAVESILCRAPGLPVIALSRLHDDELALRCIRAGAEDHVYKDPESVEGLLRALGFAMERSRARVGAGHTPASAGEHGEPRPTTRRTVAPALPRPLGQE